jgi:hypothetical protein
MDMKYEEFKQAVDAAMESLKEDALFDYPPEGMPPDEWIRELAKELEGRT